jgi:hypothetical protein
VIGIEGADCGVTTLGVASEMTAGVVTVVKPLGMLNLILFYFT